MGRIIKETTSHNAALLAKEAAEAQARLDDLTENEEKKRRKLNPSASDIRRRQLGDISSILQGRKRNNGTERQEKSGHKDGGRSKDRSCERDRRRSRRDESEEDKKEKHRPHRRTEDRTKDEHRHRRGRSRSPSRKDRKYRNRSPLSSEDEDERPRRSKSHRDKSRKSHDLIDSEASKRRNYGRLAEDNDTYSDPPKPAKHTEEDDSDPLEEFIGPAPPSKPPIRTRGRGAIRGAAALDSRFSEDYDPSSDVQFEPTPADDWEEAVETYRDRQKWKQQGAERLRAAGFTDEQVRKWEKGGEKDVDDVRWSKAGEKREWYVQMSIVLHPWRFPLRR